MKRGKHIGTAGAALVVLFLLSSVVGARTPDLPERPEDATALPATHTLPEISLLQSDAAGVTLEYRPRYTGDRRFRSAGREYVAVEFEGAIPENPPLPAGVPDIRFRAFALALPGPGSHNVRVVATDYEEVFGAELAPVPRLRVRDGYLEADTYEYVPAATSVPGAQAVLSMAGTARSVMVGTLRLYPVQYDGAARVIRKVTRMVVEVRFAAGAAPRVKRDDLELLGDAVVNHTVLRSWAVTPVRRTSAPGPSVLATGTWYRMTVTQEGLYRLDAATLGAAGINLSGVDPRTIRVFGNGGRELSEAVADPRPQDLEELAIHVEGESDGQFGPSDFVLFYGRGSGGWRYDPGGKTLRHVINRYSSENYYWLTFGGQQGKRMAALPSVPTQPDVVTEQFTDGIYIEEEKINILGSGKDWLGQSIAGPSGSFTYLNPLNGLAGSGQIVYRYRLVSRASSSATFTVREGGSQIGTHVLPPIYGYLEGTAGEYQGALAAPLPNNTSQLSFAYQSGGASSGGWVDWLEIIYPRMLWGVNGELRFRSPDTAGVVEYRLQQFGQMPWVLDVTRHSDVALVTGIQGSYSFRLGQTAGGVTEFVAAVPGVWKTPAAIQRATNQDLRGYSGGAVFIIVTSQEFRAAADRLKAYRESPAGGALPTLVVDVAQIYNEFGGGLPDITAVRDYLKYAYDNWTPSPRFVLFLGGASYDYKGILGQKSSYVPTWQSGESLYDVGSYATDDYFVMFGAGSIPSLVTGRISSRTRAEADAVVGKIIAYEQNSMRDSWKMRLMYVGDDAWTPEGGEIGDLTLHTSQSERLATLYTPDEFEKRKIYIAEYPTVNTAQGRRKPEAYQDIIKRINEGALIVNFTGHGNPTVWTHERIFEVQSSIPQLVNADRLAFFVLATCNFSQFDDPKSYTGSELLLNRTEGGAVAVLSASRKVYAVDNATLNQQTFARLFVRDAFGRLTLERPATALFRFKILVNTDNDQKFFFMGDPTMRLGYPARYASIDSINGIPMDSAGGGAPQDPVQLRSLARVTVSGTIRDATNTIDASYNGTLSLSVNDATRTRTIVNFYPGANFNYLEPGGTIYRGSNSVTGGRFDATFVVPKDIAYADSTARGRMVAYFSGPDGDGSGYTGLLRIGGTDTTAVDDRHGPSMNIFVNTRSFRSGDLVSPNPVLIVDLTDSSGINTSGSGIGHRIEAWINGSQQSVDLTDSYTSTLDDYRRGTIRYQLRDLPAGSNMISIRAWDSFNNSAMAETIFEIATDDRLTVSQVLNYPNPFASGTEFTFRQNTGGALDVTIKVYTLAGRVIQTLEGMYQAEPFMRIPWDGRDRDGDIIANGVYLYKLIVRTADGRFGSETLGKLSILR